MNLPQKIFTGLLVSVCLMVAWFAFAWGIADQYAYDAQQVEQGWAKGGPMTREKLATAIADAEQAIDWAPGHPQYRDQLAGLLIYRYILDRDRATADAIKVHLLQSRAIRPAWPINWATYIRAKVTLGEVDDDLSNAIVQATRFGPWEAAVLQAVTEAGVAHYGAVSDEAKVAVIENIKRGLASPVPRMQARTAQLVEVEARGWTLNFTQEMLKHLAAQEWSRRTEEVFVRLSLAFWPVAPSHQRRDLIQKISIAVINKPSKRMLNRVREAKILPQICPLLPRTKRFKQMCRKATTS